MIKGEDEKINIFAISRNNFYESEQKGKKIEI